MNRIDKLFSEKKENILSIYMTAGYPGPEDTLPVLAALQRNGADLVEIGMPFSDPLADGPVIQQSSQVALSNGMSLNKLFTQLEGLRPGIQIPMVLMGYLNPVLKYGMEAFLERCSQTGIDGLILPDLPPDEYADKYQSLFAKHGIYNILLITPQTSDERIQTIASLSGGFLYMVSDASTTGARGNVTDQQKAYFKRIGDMNLKLPRLIGFGISNRETFNEACSHAQGAIIGSAFIQALKGEGSLEEKIRGFLENII